MTNTYIDEINKKIDILDIEKQYKQTISNHPLFNKIYKKAKTFIQDIIKNINISYSKNKQISIQDYLHKHLESTFISDTIKHSLKKNISYVDLININYKKHSFCFYNFCYKNNSKNIQYKQWVVMSIYLLTIAELYDKIVDGVNIYIYPSDLKKNIPNHSIITTDNVNSGYTTFTNKKINDYIVLFRKEDIENIFVHECIHYLDIDKNLFNKTDIYMKKIFTIQNNILLNEGYTEILTIIYVSICNSILLNIDVSNILYNELLYSILQSNKILSVYSIHNEQEFYKWKDTTNLFSYVIVKTICLFYIDIFLNLFYNYKTLEHIHFSFFIVQYFKSISNILFSYKEFSFLSLFLQQTLKKSIYKIEW